MTCEVVIVLRKINQLQNGTNQVFSIHAFLVLKNPYDKEFLSFREVSAEELPEEKKEESPKATKRLLSRGQLINK